MEYRILGSLEIEHDGRPIPLRGRRQRALLVNLLLSANEVVPDDRLLEDLWGADPPKSGRTALRVRVSQLRKAIEPAGDVLLTRAPGYVLHAEPDLIDARRFERLLAEGRAARAAGDAERAAGALRAALALWRGPALADVAYEPFVQAEIARLEELRLVALEERIDVDLALGGHAELVGELEALVAKHPLRERMRGQQMLALYRSGRQAEALAAYREARQALVGELGIEPSRALQELESAILRQELSLEPPTPTAPAEEPPVRDEPPGEERKLVTVVVADLTASPALSDVRDPERAGALLERVVEAVTAEIDEAGGRIEAVAGGVLTAAFGTPVAQEDHAERGLQAALALRRRLDEAFGDDLVLRIGVDTGEVVVGRAREGAATLSGGIVLNAARIAGAAGPGVILVGERAAAATRGVFEFGSPLSEGADAGGSPLACRPLVRALTLTRTHGSGGLRSAFVGRDGELELLEAAYRRAVDQSRPRLVTVMGDAGVGKTRLVRELWNWLAAQSPEPLRRTGRCLAYGRGATYRPLADILREQYGLLENDSPETIRARLGEREILAIVLGVPVAPELHPLAKRDQLHAAWVELLTELSRERPVVVLLEDLHWAQEPLLDLLERTLDDVAGRVLLVATARPELLDERPSWGRRRDAATAWLEPLSLEDAGRMLDGLGDGELSVERRRAVLERAEGNPFFLEELLSGLHDHALTAESEVPDSVQAVLAARIDLLRPIEKAALQAASVIGRVFWRGPVRELLDGGSPDFAVLEAHDLIRRRTGSTLAGEREFAFKHALTRDVAYAGLPAERRARLHAGFADWLQRVAGGRDQDAPFLAHHYSEAARPDEADLAWEGKADELEALRAKAVAWLRTAADLAIARYELDEGIALLERALALADSDEVRLELWRSVGRANALRFDGEALWTAMLKAIELSTDSELQGELYSELALETATRSGIWRRMPEYPLVDGWIDTALELAPPDSPAQARALVAKGIWNPFEGAKPAREASAIAESLGDVELRSYAWDARGVAEFVAGRYELGRAFAERRFELLDQISNPDHRADIYAAPISGCIWGGRFNEARRLARLHDETTAPLTPHHRLHGLPSSARSRSCWARGRPFGSWRRGRSRPWPRTRRPPAFGTPARC